MSTIEKAAARLSARQRSKNRSASLKVEAAPSRDLTPDPVVHTALHPPDVPQSASSAPPAARLPERTFEINLARIRENGFLTPDVGRSQLAQEMRRIKRPLLLNMQRAQARGDDAPPPNLIMVTSALPGEGKTFISINLAMSLAAEVDRRVLLVDADVSRGDVSRQLGIPARRGLSDLLRESSYLSDDGVLATNVERLSILPSGAPTDHVDELFASGLMAVLTRALADTDPNRVIVFDASPLLATTEAAVLAQRMGQTVVVVEANRTPQDAVAHALSQLEGCANVSLVLNKTTGKSTSGYSYGYVYGSDTAAEERNDKPIEAA